jgi:hypothetical protein
VTVVPPSGLVAEMRRLAYDAADPLCERDEWRWKFLALVAAHLLADLELRRN